MDDKKLHIVHRRMEASGSLARDPVSRDFYAMYKATLDAHRQTPCTHEEIMHGMSPLIR